ncbi:MAG: response regulator [Deltaproteobacteria bacterium]|nr:response regulator [Deltaproteobacteria bacterium]
MRNPTKQLNSKKKILIVEDNLDLTYILLRLVENAGYDSILAVNGKEAVEIADHQLPDLILMDIMMPEMNGFEATRLIRENPNTRCIPIIAVTAMSSAKDREECLKSGCSDYMSKPFTPSQLAATIEKHLKAS